MRTDADLYLDTARIIEHAGGGNFSPASIGFTAWLTEQSVPAELIELFSISAPKSQAWLGAGVLFDEKRIIERNNFHAVIAKRGLFIVGSAANGDYVCVETKNGQVGYLRHDVDLLGDDNIYDIFVPVSDSIGMYIKGVNSMDSNIPDDYWEAKKKK